MIKQMLRPFLKRFIGLFISMAFVSMLSAGLLVAFTSSMTNLKSSYQKYKEDYGSVDVLVSTNITLRNNLEGIESIDGVDRCDERITMDSYLKTSKDAGRTITSRIFSYDGERNNVFKRYIIQDGGYKEDKINVSVVRKFAKNNNIKVGQPLYLGYANYFMEVNVADIVETPEAIYVRASDYIWSDNFDFGFIYVDEPELDKIIINLIDKVTNDSTFREIYERMRQMEGIDLPDIDKIKELVSVGDRYAQLLANQALVKVKDKNQSEKIRDNILSELSKSEIVQVKSSQVNHELLYEIYMKNAMKQLTVGATFLPVFFYLVTMVVIGLFINQIIKLMTQDIGIMMSIGISPKEVTGLFCIFTLLMTLVASLLSLGIGFGLNYYLATIFIAAYSIPTIPSTLNPWICVISVISLIAVGQAACLLSCLKVYKITPKDAMLSNETKRKKLPKWLDKTIDKAPMNLKLSMNSIAQNPRRFLVSTFSMFAAMVMMLVTGYFYVSKNELLGQTLNRRLNYDCQVYLTEKDKDNFIEQLRTQESIEDVEECYFTYIPVESGNETIYFESLGVDTNASDLVYIPSKNGKGKLSVPEMGIIITESNAEQLKVKKGDTIKINNKDVEIVDISKQYFHFTSYMSKAQMEALELENVVTSYLVNVNDEAGFLSYLSQNKQAALTVFTKSLKKDMNSIFSAVDVFILILIAFSLGMSFVILTIMSQNALMEQKRPISVMRAIGFRIINISNIWTAQSIAQLMSSILFAIPAGVGISNLLFTLASSKSQIYPFIFDWRVLLFAIGFIIVVIVASHMVSMISIRKWNLADNTRSRD